MRGPIKQAAHVAYEVGFFLVSLASRMLNAIFYRGSMHQTLSARAFIESFTSREWQKRKARIDRGFALLTFGAQTEHCAGAWASEVARARKTLQRNGGISA